MSTTTDRAAEIIESNIWVDGDHLAQALADAGVLASRRLEAIIDRMAGKAVAALDLHGDEPGMTTKICRTCHVPQPCPTSQVLNADAVQILEQHDEQVRADERAQLTEADFIAYGVERGWLKEKVRPEFHYPGGVEPAIRQFVTAGEDLPLTPPPTPEEIEVLKRRLAGLEP